MNKNMKNKIHKQLNWYKVWKISQVKFNMPKLYMFYNYKSCN